MAGTAALKEPEQMVDEVSAPRILPSTDFRQHIGHVSRQSSVYFSGRMFALAAGYFFKIYLTRELGAEALGTYALGLTIIGSLGIFNAFGLSRSATRFVSAYRATEQYELLRGLLVRSILMLFFTNLLFVPILLLAGPVIAVRIYHAPALSGYLWIFAALMCFGTFNTFFARVLAGYKEVARSTVLTTFLGTPLMVLCTIAFVTLGWGLRGYLIAQASADGIMFLLLVGTVWRLTPQKTRLYAGPLPPLEHQSYFIFRDGAADGIFRFPDTARRQNFSGILLKSAAGWNLRAGCGNGGAGASHFAIGEPDFLLPSFPICTLVMNTR